MRYSIVVPVYNSQPCLAELIGRLDAVLSATNEPFEIICVDDGSVDDSWSELCALCRRYPALTAIQMMRNFGQARATLCGLSSATGDTVVTMDDDLQHPPEELPGLIEYMESNPDLDCVFGSFDEKKHSRYRNLGSQLVRWVNAQAFGLPKDIQASSLRVMRSSLVKTILVHETDTPALTALIYGSTKSVVSVNVRHDERFAGESNYTLRRQMRQAFDNICNVSMLPLHLVSLIGGLICFLAVGYSVLILIRYLAGNITVPGWTTLTILVSFFAGAILLSLGVIGEYLSRVLREVRGAPKYAIRRVSTGAESEARAPHTHVDLTTSSTTPPYRSPAGSETTPIRDRTQN